MGSQSRLLRTRAQWAALVLSAALGIVLFARVDLAPRVEADFFFATDDPQLRQARRIEQQFASAPQIFVAARSERLFSHQYLQRIRTLTEDLRRVEGVMDARSLTHGPEELEDVAESPFWSRLLLAPDRSATFIVLRVADEGNARTVTGVQGLSPARAAPARDRWQPLSEPASTWRARSRP